MDSDLIMSATAGAAVGESILDADYWRAFAPTIEPADILAWVSKAVEKPHLSVKSEVAAGIALRARFEGRLGLAGVIHWGKIPIAFPVVKGGRVLEVEIIEVISDGCGMEGWVIGESEGVRFGFYDVLHSTGMSDNRPGQSQSFVVNALALSLKRVKPLSHPRDPDGDLLPFSLSNLRTYLPRKTGNPDRGVFQSPIDGIPEGVWYDGREFHCLPVSLGDEDGVRVTIDLFVGRELAESLGSPFHAGDELAGVIWLQGYAADRLAF